MTRASLVQRVAQERYVSYRPSLDPFRALCEREAARSPWSTSRPATTTSRSGPAVRNKPVDMDLPPCWVSRHG
jgi:hypothetical protein